MTKKASYIISAIIHPGIVSIFSFATIATIAHGSIKWGIIDSLIFLAGITPAWAWHFRALHRKKTLDYYQVEGYHKIILPLTFSGLLAVFLIYLAINVPSLVIQSFIALFITMTILIIINRFWKISLHAATTMICAALFIPISSTVVIVMMCLSVLTGLSRLQLKVHSPRQVAAGWLYGFGFASILVILMQSWS
jgi:membrane-associated phospholipid phosphatase